MPNQQWHRTGSALGVHLMPFEEFRCPIRSVRCIVARPGARGVRCLMKMRKYALLLLACLPLIPLGSRAADAGTVPPEVRIIFPNQDDFNQFAGMGDSCGSPPSVLASFQHYVQHTVPRQFVPYDIAKLNIQGVMGLYYVYRAQDCLRLKKYFDANVFILARVRLVSYVQDPDAAPSSCVYDVDIKVYSSQFGKELVLFSKKKVPLAGLSSLLNGKESQLWNQVLGFLSEPRGT